MTMANRFIAETCGIGVVQLALMVLKAAGLISIGWGVVLLPLEAVACICALAFLCLIACLVDDINNGALNEGYKDDGNGEGGNGKE